MFWTVHLPKSKQAMGWGRFFRDGIKKWVRLQPNAFESPRSTDPEASEPEERQNAANPVSIEELKMRGRALQMRLDAARGSLKACHF